VGKKLVAQIPTRFGRLAYLSSLRDGRSGRYTHPAMADRFGHDAADRALCHSHHQVFMEWLRLNLSDQKADLEEYLRGAAIPAESLPYRELAPGSAHEVERLLYLADFEVILQLVSFEAGAAFGRDASLRR